MNSAQITTNTKFLNYYETVKRYYYKVRTHFAKLMNFQQSPISVSGLRSEIIQTLRYCTDPKIDPDYPIKFLYIYYKVTENAYRLLKLDLYNNVRFVENDMVITYTEQQLTLCKDYKKEEYWVGFYNQERIIEHNFDDSYKGNQLRGKEFYFLSENRFNQLSEFFRSPFQAELVSQ